MTITRYLVLLAFVGIGIACGGSDNGSPTAPTEVTGSAPFSATDLVAGTGAEAVAGRTIVVDYTGWLYSDTAAENKGRQFDTSLGRGPYAFVLGAGGVIRGWIRACPECAWAARGDW